MRQNRLGVSVVVTGPVSSVRVMKNMASVGALLWRLLRRIMRRRQMVVIREGVHPRSRGRDLACLIGY